MQRSKKSFLGVLMATAGLVFIGPAAEAMSVLYSYEGTDYSHNSSSGQSVYACDQEDDGNQVEVQSYRRNTEVRFIKRDSFGGGCTAETITTAGQTVYKHRIVELQLFDKVGAWVYPA